MTQTEKRFNVILVHATGLTVILPCRPYMRRMRNGHEYAALPLRNASYLMCNVTAEYADGFARGYEAGRHSRASELADAKEGHMRRYLDAQRADAALVSVRRTLDIAIQKLDAYASERS